jgi:transcriptional regulator with XRE-family HTH domain
MPLTASQVQVLRGATPGEAGNRLAAATKLSEVSQADLSRALGMTQQYVNDVARGRYQTITVDNARRFAEFFGCAIEDLFPSSQSEARTA